MRLRVARHTKDLDKIIHFYTQLINLEILGSFQNHDGYDGIFIGLPDADWHLEFTVSKEEPIHQFDEDDLLVFYFNSIEDLNLVQSKLDVENCQQKPSKNPYWNENGFLYKDPDGFGIILTLKN